MELSIIIVNYNVKYFLEQCLRSVIKACTNIEAEILVIDNNSLDGSEDFFKGRFPEVDFTWQKENVGFAVANNVALKKAVGDNILFLNPDTILPEDGLEKCLAFFSEQQQMGALGVRMIDGSGHFLPESKRGFPSLFTSFCKMAGLTKRFPSSPLLANYYLGRLPENSNNEVDILAGAFMLISRAVLKEVGSFDETFFMYAEDIDLSYRIQQAGYKNYYFAQTTILHFKGESTQKQSPHYTRVFYGAMLLFVQKHYGKITARLYSFMISLTIIAKKGWAKSKTIFQNGRSGTQKKPVFDAALIMGKQKDFEKIEAALRKDFSTVILTTELPTRADVVLVCCEPALSFKEIIALMQDAKGACEFLIHAAGTNSIVGSSDKNVSGRFIPLN